MRWSGLALAMALCLGALVPTGAAGAESSLPELSIAIARGSVTVTGAGGSGGVEVLTRAAGGLTEPAPVLVLLAPGVTPAALIDFLAADKADDANSISRFGRIVFDAPLRPGAGSEVQTRLQPGTYVALDAEGEHSRSWSHTVFEISAAAEPDTLPPPAAVERTSDFAFSGPRTLHDGELVRFENEGFLAHIDMALPARGRRSAEKLARDLLAGHEAAAQGLLTGAPVILAGALSEDAFQQSRITAAPGWYVQSCLLAIQDGRSEAQLGMERVIRVLS